MCQPLACCRVNAKFGNDKLNKTTYGKHPPFFSFRLFMYNSTEIPRGERDDFRKKIHYIEVL